MSCPQFLHREDEKIDSGYKLVNKALHRISEKATEAAIVH